MRVTVIGAGISGLACAFRLTELAAEPGRDLELHLLEASGRTGGVIATERREGCLLEHGPESMISDKPWGLALVRRLGLEEELIGTSDRHRRSFVVHGGRLHPVPEGFQLLAPSRFAPLAASEIFSPAGKARMALELTIPPRLQPDDESLGAFVTRRLGREALERIAEPMIAGIYGADPWKLSVQATMPRFVEMERKYGSVIRGMWERRKEAEARVDGGGLQSGVSGARYGLFVSFRDGMQRLPDALVARLPPGALRLRAPVQRLTRDGNVWHAWLPDGTSIESDAVVLALPAYRSAELLDPLDPELARLLAAIPYAASATMSLVYAREDVPHPLDGFGFVVPAREGLTLLGCTFTHVKWPGRAPEGVALLRAFLPGRALAERTDEELADRVRADLGQLLGIRAQPRFTLTRRHPRSMAQYAVGHLERVVEIESRAARLPGLALAGNGFRGIGIPDCIHAGERAAEAIFQAAADARAIERSHA